MFRIARTLTAISMISVAGTLALTPHTEAAAPTNARDVASRLNKNISVSWESVRLEDAIAQLSTLCDIRFEPLWISERQPEGLDRDAIITLRMDNVAARLVIEALLAQLEPEGCTWQLTATGACQIGPKSRLNKDKRLVIYDIRDLITEVPSNREVPKIDLQQALQTGGNAQAPFTQQNNEPEPARQEQAKKDRETELADLIRQFVETDQWIENGGTGASMRLYQGSLIISAPDYIHRGIQGYVKTQRAARER